MQSDDDPGFREFWTVTRGFTIHEAVQAMVDEGEDLLSVYAMTVGDLIRHVAELRRDAQAH